MKPEVRVLLSRCVESICAAAVMRGVGFDILMLSRGCEELCERLREEGYAQELRYSLGDCPCGFPPPPRKPKVDLSAFLEDLARAARNFIANKAKSVVNS
ncbi:MAG: hypothetical protein N3F67_04490 [Acidilobaceae archaeon]|nr:hypothetical protein [Acidilobaceae archaeon]